MSIVLKYNITDPNAKVAIPITEFTGEVNVEWGDNTSTVFTEQGTTPPHIYTNLGVYTVTITGKVKNFGHGGNVAGMNYLTDVISWDNEFLVNLTDAFTNLSGKPSTLTSVPSNLPPNVTTLNDMFNGLSNFNQDISSWDTKNVTSMVSMFYFASSFNQPIGSWNVSNVTDMTNMFYHASSFNQPLDKWNVSKLQRSMFMFFQASDFNQPLITWDTSNLTLTSCMFTCASAFNQSLSSWKMSKVDDMSFMFQRATAFDQPLGMWDISKSTSILGMLSETKLSATNYSSTLVGWAGQTVLPDLTLGAQGLQYNPDAQSAHDILTSSPNNWTIDDIPA